MATVNRFSPTAATRSGKRTNTLRSVTAGCSASSCRIRGGNSFSNPLWRTSHRIPVQT